jgi:hypothetical protein
MAKDYIPGRDEAFLLWLEQFLSNCDNYQSALGLTAAQLSSLTNANAEFDAGYHGLLSARLACDNALQFKDTSRVAAEAVVRKIAQQLRANPNVSNALLAQLGLDPRTKPSRQAPLNDPTLLTATVNPDAGTVTLSWKPNGNRKGTSYVIERLDTVEGVWTPVSLSSRTRETLDNIVAGVQETYRVRAARRSELSNPSNPFTIYLETALAA